MEPRTSGTLPSIVAALEKAHGRPAPPPHTDPFHQVLLENVAYLVSDDRREAAFQALAKRVGLTPQAILAAKPAVLREVAAKGGMLPDHRVGKLLRCAELALVHWKSGTRQVLGLPLAEARKSLKRFPGLGDPGAEKVLMTAGSHAVLALDSNALRVLNRLGFGEEKKAYAATYRLTQAAAQAELPRDPQQLWRASQLLRLHGQQVCRRSKPQCGDCVVSRSCRFYLAG